MTEKRRKKILNVLAHRRPDITLILEDIHDPHNVSAILRSADAVGVMEVHLVYTNSPFPRLGKKSSASATKWVPRRKHHSMSECVTALRSDGFRILGTYLGAFHGSGTATAPGEDTVKESVPLYELDLTGRVAFIFGNEHSGVSPGAAELADLNFHIPMSGMIESLNVSVACAVTLYEAFRQRMFSKAPALPAKDKKALRELRMEWLSPPSRRK
jgi:tRNA (guanosine-2'-O-)-methyltransferase